MKKRNNMKKRKEVKEPIASEKVQNDAIKVKNEAIEYYILKVGETLQDVAKKFNTTVAKLNGLNGNIEVVGSNQIRVK